MSNLKGSILKGGSGKVGKIIQSSWKGIDYIRIKPSHVKNPKTPDQQSHRSKFKAVTELAKIILQPIIRPIWNPLSKNNMGFNKFTQYNIHAFQDTGNIKNYKDLKFSLGDIELPREIHVKRIPNTKTGILISWTYNPEIKNTNPNDIFNIIALEENIDNYNIIVLDNTSILRKECKATIELPFKGNSTIHIYPYFKRSDGTCYSHNSYAKVKSIQ